MTEIISLEKINKLTNDISFIHKYINGKSYSDNFKSFKVNSYDLANGEYNYNFLLNIILIYDNFEIHEKAVLRINYGSQMNLNNQIEYEYHALSLLENSNLAPKPIFYDNSKLIIEKDFLVMSYIDGKHLSYSKDMKKAANTLAKIHKIKIPKDNFLIAPENPFSSIIKECETMYSVYANSIFFDNKIDDKVKKIFSKCKEINSQYIANNHGFINNHKNNISFSKSIINTELNSSNFLIDGDNCIVVDWEKPIIGEKEQDLGHFLAPTTTFWKTDVILDKIQIEDFLKNYYMFYNENSEYIANINDKNFLNFKTKVFSYIIMNCLRGITWCSMAWVEYNSNKKAILNEFTYNKLKKYLEYDFIDNIINTYL